MIDPTDKDIGRGVVYTGNRGWGGPDEAGVITSFNDHSVFVRYDGKRHSQGTNHVDLEWELDADRLREDRDDRERLLKEDGGWPE